MDIDSVIVCAILIFVVVIYFEIRRIRKHTYVVKTISLNFLNELINEFLEASEFINQILDKSKPIIYNHDNLQNFIRLLKQIEESFNSYQQIFPEFLRDEMGRSLDDIWQTWIVSDIHLDSYRNQISPLDDDEDWRAKILFLERADELAKFKKSVNKVSEYIEKELLS